MFNFTPSQWFWVTCWLVLQSVSPVYGLEVVRTELNLTPNSLSKSSTCSADVDILTSQLLKDLPSYANRVIQRARRLDRTVDSFSYVLVAGNPEFEPLSLGPSQYTSTVDKDSEPEQVFLTTLERQYRDGEAFYRQHYHWLFLTQTPDGWRLALMFSRIGSASETRPPTPPRESSDGVIGQAVKLWLRDCRAGTLRTASGES